MNRGRITKKTRAPFWAWHASTKNSDGWQRISANHQTTGRILRCGWSGFRRGFRSGRRRSCWLSRRSAAHGVARLVHSFTGFVHTRITSGQTDGKYGSEAGWVTKKREADAKKAKEEAAKVASPGIDTNAPALPK